MIKIDRSALALANVAGGAMKQFTADSPSATPPAPTVSGSSSMVVNVNGKEVFNQSVTF